MAAYVAGKISSACYPQWFIQNAVEWTSQEIARIKEYMPENSSEYGAPSGRTLHDLKRSLEVCYGFRKKEEK